MFSSKKKETSSSNGSVTMQNSGSTNSLVSGTNVEGTIVANSDIRIDGSLKGSLDCKGRVIIGPGGEVDGDITCQNAVIEGKFIGNLTVAELLNVKESANVQGDVKTAKLLVQPGAIYNVRCEMGGQKIRGFSDEKKVKEAV